MELQCQRERLAILSIVAPFMVLLLAGSIFFVVQWKVLWNRSIADYSKVMSSIRNLAPTIQNLRSSESLAAVWDAEVQQHYDNLGKLLTRNN